jgi:hypothetical protein
MEDKELHIEIRGVYDGIAVVYNRDTNTFTWEEVALRRTTEEFRKEFENNLVKTLAKEN